MPTLFDPLGDGNAIVAYKRIASQPVYDFTVPAHANYLTAGVIHHNSTAGGAEAACHATGLYPKDWVGHRYKTPTDGWAAGETTETVRNIIQEQLCGKAGSDETFGTGFIPRRCFVGKPTMQRNAGSDTYDTVRVRWTGAGGRLDESAISTIQFKNYAQGAKRFQGPTRHWVWKDEEPPADVDTECEARYSAIPDGRSWMTFTPLGGYTSVVSRFFEDDDEGAADRGLTIITVDDVLAAGLWTPEMVAAAKRKYDAHEWPARLYGEPKQGIGRVFTTDENLILYPRSLQIAPHWGLLWGIDFGLGHPFAAVLAAIDREADVIYLMHTHRAADTHPLIHAEAIRRIGANVPVAWPRDGHNRQTGEADLTAAKDLYKKLDLKMLPHHATFPDGSISTEAAVLEMQQRFADGRLRVHEDLTDFREEYRGYHRKLDKSGNSIIVKLRDDLISCVLKIVMMKRHARAVKLGWVARPVKEDNEPVRLPIRDPWTGRIVHRFDDNTRWH